MRRCPSVVLLLNGFFFFFVLLSVLHILWLTAEGNQPNTRQIRSYGSVWEAQHRETGQVVAIKRVPIENDYEELLKEIEHMRQCESDAIVKYYGSYYFGAELWIAMEACAAGSAADIMKVCNKPFTEDHIAQICHEATGIFSFLFSIFGQYVYTNSMILKIKAGLAYLHTSMRKIHRDISKSVLCVVVKKTRFECFHLILIQISVCLQSIYRGRQSFGDCKWSCEACRLWSHWSNG